LFNSLVEHPVARSGGIMCHGEGQEIFCCKPNYYLQPAVLGATKLLNDSTWVGKHIPVIRSRALVLAFGLGKDPVNARAGSCKERQTPNNTRSHSRDPPPFASLILSHGSGPAAEERGPARDKPPKRGAENPNTYSNPA